MALTIAEIDRQNAERTAQGYWSREAIQSRFQAKRAAPAPTVDPSAYAAPWGAGGAMPSMSEADWRHLDQAQKNFDADPMNAPATLADGTPTTRRVAGILGSGLSNAAGGATSGGTNWDKGRASNPFANSGIANAAAGVDEYGFGPGQEAARAEFLGQTGAGAPPIAPGGGGGVVANPGGNDSTLDNVAAVYAEDSPLMQQAETRGLAMANRRGLMNSSMGVQAAQDAILDVAVPIGSQDASQGFQKNLSYQDYTQRDAMLGRELGSRRDLLAMELGSRSDLLSRELASREGIAGLDREARVELTNLDNAFREKLAGLELNSVERRAAASSFEGVLRLYQNTLVNINSNQNIPADAREDMLTAARDRLNSEIELMESLYGVSVTF